MEAKDLYTLPPDAVWLITGCSSGIGAGLAARLAKQTMNRVVATARQVSALSYLEDDSQKVLKLALDVTSPAAIDEAFRKAVEHFGRVDVVVNNAGYTIMGDTETSTPLEARTLFDTNFWGAVEVTKRALGVMRDENPKTGQRGGVVFFVSSMGGFVSTPGSAFYHASKFAMEGFAESVAKEVHPDWNTHFCILEPGGTRTEYLGRSFKMMGTRHPAYAAPDMPTNQMLALFDNKEIRKDFSSADDIARGMWELVTRGEKIPIRVPLGNDAWAAVVDEAGKVKEELEALGPFSTSFGGALGAEARATLGQWTQ
ncbi:retinol dehydrogenase 8 [Xylaria bambusicola]|uniref:retinol dehydrogenase 8 n=1 Tax=Xylaria bambusicola TaxID=326684 RepID=UPI002007D0A8|nr:retinol dehydrogenase 8 [Xylaria bambusicola]KAI0512850.1 retinol dehydrogenase 8 [Xylaria bambusicola]